MLKAQKNRCMQTAVKRKRSTDVSIPTELQLGSLTF
jgi:hypothetical protein